MQINLLSTIKSRIIIKCLKTVGLLICAVLNLSCGIVTQMMQDRKLSETEIRTIIENCSCVKEIQAEVDSLLSYYGDSREKFIRDDREQKFIGVESPVKVRSLTKLVDALDGRLIGIESRDKYMNEPGYVSIRFNGHRNVQFLMIFRSEEDLSVVKSRHKHLVDNIYLE